MPSSVNRAPQIPALSPEQSREKRRRVLPGIPWFPRAVPGGQLFGYTLQGLAASKFGIISLIGALIAGTAVVGSEMGAYIRRGGPGGGRAQRVNPNYSRVRTNPAAPGSLPTDAWQDPNSLGLLANANRSETPNASADAAAAAAAAAAAQANGAGADGAGADASKGGDKAGADKADKDAAASMDKALAAGPGFGGAGAGFGMGGKPQLAPIPSLFGQNGGSSAASWSGGAGAGGAKGDGSAAGGGDLGKLGAFGRTPTTANASSSRVPRALRMGGKNANFNRLGQLNKDLKPTVGMRGDAGPAYQTAAWEAQSAPSGGGVADSGAGAGTGGAPSNAGGYSGPSANPGGPVLPSANPDPAPTTAPTVSSPGNVSPWQNLVNIAVALLATASVLLTIAGILGMIHTPWTFTVGRWLSYIAAALAAAVAMIGIMIMMQGQIMQGGIFTAVGALLTALAMMSAKGFDKPVQQQTKDAAIKAAGNTVSKATQQGAWLTSRLPGVVATLGGVGGTMTAINQADTPNYVTGDASTVLGNSGSSGSTTTGSTNAGSTGKGTAGA